MMDYAVTLKNGEKVKINDHVYCSPTWTVRDGTPYSIARIMEFLPPEELSPRAQLLAQSQPSPSKGKSKATYTRARLAWYYRPSDVSDRAVADSRLLLAAIYSEICEISQLRAKCYVIHRDKLSDLSGWKKKPDHFYFYRLFDPYIKREFEVLLSSDVRNLPAHIKEVLVSRYEYVVAEKEVVPDLTDALRLCETCSEWCAHIDAVQCHRCKNHFHMSCVSPPLVAKPARGYGWTCAPCSRRHEDQVDAGEAQSGASDRERERGNTPSNNGSSVTNVTMGLPPGVTAVSNGVKIGPNGKPVRGRGRPRKEKPTGTPTASEEELLVKHYKLWPFRYFGLYTVAEDTLDPNDLIFPRAATRNGPKYQAFVAPALGEPIPPVPGLPASVTSAANSAVNPDDERGGDDTVEIFSNVHQFTPEEVALLEAHMPKIAARRELLSSVDWLTEAIRRFSQAKIAGKPLDAVNMKSPTRLLKWKKRETRYTDLPWNDELRAAFERGIEKYGAELRSVSEEVGSRSMPEVVRFYGHWKNGRLREENERLRDPKAYNKSKVTRTEDESTGNAPQSDDEDSSIVNVPTSAGRSTTYCAACRTRESRQWWKAPKGLATSILCDSCGLNWRKYTDLSARPTTREDTLYANGTTTSKTRSGEKREGTPLAGPTAKRARASTNGATTITTPPPTTTQSQPAHLRCLSCYSAGALGKILRCMQCDFRVHAGAAGVVLEPEAALQWVCDLCQNEKEPEASEDPSCLLCPRPKKDAKKTQFYPPSDTYLRACKPTEGQGWVHVLCSVFIPEVRFADSSRLRLVEGINTIPKERWTTRCTLCHEDGGAVVQCSNCPKKYHVSCAWKNGHKFGFEIQPVKSSRRDQTSMVTFKRVTGAMNAVVFCKEHTSYRRDIYDICSSNDVGESALQVYCRTYKQAPLTPHGLLRRARRLDQLLPATVSDGSKSISNEAENYTCDKCKTSIAPRFYNEKNPVSGENMRMCHRCYYGKKQQSKEVIGFRDSLQSVNLPSQQ